MDNHHSRRLLPNMCEPLLWPHDDQSGDHFVVPVHIVGASVLYAPFVKELIWKIYSSLLIRCLVAKDEPLVLFIMARLERDELSVQFSQSIQDSHLRTLEVQQQTTSNANIIAQVCVSFGCNVEFSMRFNGIVSELSDADYLPMMCSSLQRFITGSEKLVFSFQKSVVNEPQPPPPLPVEVSISKLDQVPLPASPEHRHPPQHHRHSDRIVTSETSSIFMDLSRLPLLQET